MMKTSIATERGSYDPLYLIRNKSKESSFGHILFHLLILWFVASFWACRETALKSTEEALDVPQEKVTDGVENSSPSSNFVDSVQVLTDINRKPLPFNGRFFSARSWKDKLGENIFILSEKGKYNEGNGRKELFAYHYIKRDTEYDLLWQMNDFVDGWACDLDIQLINFFPFISDIDADGIAETAIFYSLNNLCDAVPFPAKLIVHEGEEKFAIRGIRNQFLGPPEEVQNEYRLNEGLTLMKYKNLDTGSSKWDSSIIHFYSNQWDEFIALENQLQGALADSLVQIIN